MPTFVLEHRHAPSECGAAFAAWKGFASPLSGGHVLASCLDGGHRVWWTVVARTPEAALAQLPEFVGERTVVHRVREVPVP